MQENQARIFTEKCFYDGLNYLDFQMLDCISGAASPLGAWVMKERLAANGVQVSTTTIGRRLKELEAQGYVVQRSNLGRILTKKGEDYLQHVNYILRKSRLTQDIIETVSVKHYLQLVNIYQARRGLETEAARLAAASATAEELAELRENTRRYKALSRAGATEHEILQVSLEFHYIIAKICKNQFITLLLNMILNENAQFEKTLKNPIIYNQSDQYADEHDGITDAIAAGDSEGAAALMMEHMNSIINREETQIGFMNSGCLLSPADGRAQSQ